MGQFWFVAKINGKRVKRPCPVFKFYNGRS